MHFIETGFRSQVNSDDEACVDTQECKNNPRRQLKPIPHKPACELSNICFIQVYVWGLEQMSTNLKPKTLHFEIHADRVQVCCGYYCVYIGLSPSFHVVYVCSL
jgi:hypothetical protein